LSVGQTVPAVVPPTRSNVRTFGAIAAAVLIGVVSWQVATSRAERQHIAEQKNTTADRSSSETMVPAMTNSVGIGTEPVAALAPSASVAVPVVVPDAPLSNSSAIVPTAPAKPLPPPKPKLPPFDAAEAQRSLEFLARTAKIHCARLPGPRAFGVTVTFGPSGRAIKAKANTFLLEPTGTCAQGVLLGARVSAFDPAMGNGTAAAAVALD
jgi:hypothetical protein